MINFLIPSYENDFFDIEVLNISETLSLNIDSKYYDLCLSAK
jgi:hypothetical protein